MAWKGHLGTIQQHGDLGADTAQFLQKGIDLGMQTGAQKGLMSHQQALQMKSETMRYEMQRAETERHALKNTLQYLVDKTGGDINELKARLENPHGKNFIKEYMKHHPEIKDEESFYTSIPMTSGDSLVAQTKHLVDQIGLKIAKGGSGAVSEEEFRIYEFFQDKEMSGDYLKALKEFMGHPAALYMLQHQPKEAAAIINNIRELYRKNRGVFPEDKSPLASSPTGSAPAGTPRAAEAGPKDISDHILGRRALEESAKAPPEGYMEALEAWGGKKGASKRVLSLEEKRQIKAMLEEKNLPTTDEAVKAFIENNPNWRKR